MQTIQLAVLIPLAAGLLWFGLGALVDALAARLSHTDRSIPALLWPVTGFAVSIFVTNTISRLGIAAPFNVALVVLLAVAGAALQWRKLGRPSGTTLALLLSAVPVLVAFSGAIVIAGPTILGYLLDTNTGVHSLGADWLIHHGGQFHDLPKKYTDTTLVLNFFDLSAYPSGSHALYGLIGALTHTSLFFASTPLMGTCLAVAAITTAWASKEIGSSTFASMIVGFLLSCGALTFAFGLSSELKEIVTLPLITGMTAVAVADRERLSRWATVCLIVAFSAALYSIIGLPCVAWAAPFALIAAHRHRTATGFIGSAKEIAVSVAVAVIATVVALFSLLPGVISQLKAAQALSATNAALASDPGNLLGPIQKIQAFGIWIGPDHRLFPTDPRDSFILIGVTFALAGFGLIAMARERRWSQLVWLGALAIIWYVLTWRGTMWLDSKLVMLSAIVVLLPVGKGVTALAAMQTTGRSRALVAAVLIAPTVIGTLASDAKLYRGTNVAPEGRYKELEHIDAKYRSLGPALFTEFDEYALYTLRHIHAIGPGYSALISGLDINDEPIGYGHSADLDRIKPLDIDRFKVIITAHSPQRSSPGSNWRLAESHEFFDVWVRNPGTLPQVAQHVPFGKVPLAAIGPATATPTCRVLESIAGKVDPKTQHLVARVAPGPTYSGKVTTGDFSVKWAAQWAATGTVSGQGRMRIVVPPAARGTDHEFWIVGTVNRAMTAVDDAGHRLGTIPRVTGGDGNIVGPVRVPAGVPAVSLVATPASLQPGDATPSVLKGFEFQPAGALVNRAVAPADVKSLCGATLDWLEVVDNN